MTATEQSEKEKAINRNEELVLAFECVAGDRARGKFPLKASGMPQEIRAGDEALQEHRQYLEVPPAARDERRWFEAEKGMETWAEGGGAKE